MKKGCNRRQFLYTFGVGVVGINGFDQTNFKQFEINLQNNAVKVAGGNKSKQQPPYQLLTTGSVKPRGWILEQMRVDLHHGLKGHFPKITSNVSKNLFAAQERKAGTWVEGARKRKEKCWWAGEHEGYWMDSLLRSAILLEEKEYIEIVRVWVERILEKFEETGYIGIYDAESRFPAKGFDGELWTQSRAFQALLAWYEFTGDKRVIDAVQATVRTTIEHYRKTTYFGRPGADGGVTHGVGYMDTLEWLWRLTGDRYYGEAAVWLYTDYSLNTPKDFEDLTASKMSDPVRPWFDHGAHVGEAVYLPRIAYFFSGNPQYGEAAKNVLPKLLHHTNPAGGMALGYLEAVAGAQGGGHVLNENCAHIEALMSLNRLFAYQAEAEIGAWREKCIFNVVQGARSHPVDKSVIYLSRDNRRHAADVNAHGGRELFSACHEAASCCVLNVSRVMPYYVEGMWYRSNEGSSLFKNGYGPSLLTTKIAGAEIRVEEITEYPFSDKVKFKVDVSKPVTFELLLRIPEGSGKVKVEAGKDIEVDSASNLIRISRNWQRETVISVDFDFQVERKVQPDGKEVYWQWGVLVFSLPFDVEKQIRTEINAVDGVKSGFYEYLVKPSQSSDGWYYLAGVDSSFKLIRTNENSKYPWENPCVALEGFLYDRKGSRVSTRLVPIGSTALRRTTFPFHNSTPADPDVTKQKKVTADDDPMRKF